MADTHDWITLHAIEFEEPVDGNARLFNGPDVARRWRMGPDSEIGPDGLRTLVSRVWAAFGLYDDRAVAEDVICRPYHYLDFLGETRRSWHALLCPISHRGSVKWFEELETGTAIRPAPVDPGGKMVVLTTAGFNAVEGAALEADMPRRKDFARNVDIARTHMASATGNLAHGNQALLPRGSDGLTYSIWESDNAMMAAAYDPGAHRERLNRYKSEKTADRTSFTRARLIQTSGTWEATWNSALI